MQSAAAAIGDGWDEGKVRPLLVPWPQLARVIRPIGGQQVVVAAAPSVGKTMFAGNWAAESGAHTLYMSADTDQRTWTKNMAALATGHETTIVDRRLERSRSWRLQYMEAVQDRFPNLYADFASGPSIPSVLHRAEALTEVWGSTPELVVIDTATDVQRQGEDYASWRKNWIAYRGLARYLNAVVMLLHHVKDGPARNGDAEPAQSSAKYGADEFAEIMLGLWRPGGDPTRLTVSVLKNRAGLRQVRVPFAAEYARGRVTPITEEL